MTRCSRRRPARNRRGAAESAVAYLTRALREPVAARRAAAAAAAARAGRGADLGPRRPRAPAREAWDGLTDPLERALAAGVLARAVLFTESAPAEAREVALRGARELPDDDGRRAPASCRRWPTSRSSSAATAASSPTRALARRGGTSVRGAGARMLVGRRGVGRHAAGRPGRRLRGARAALARRRRAAQPRQRPALHRRPRHPRRSATATRCSRAGTRPAPTRTATARCSA